VNHQVESALGEFAERVAARELIVVGAVYDFRNDMRQGYGSVNIVNVNGHTEGAKVAAFARALDERGNADSRLASSAAMRHPPARPKARRRRAKGKQVRRTPDARTDLPRDHGSQRHLLRVLGSSPRWVFTSNDFSSQVSVTTEELHGTILGIGLEAHGPLVLVSRPKGRSSDSKARPPRRRWLRQRRLVFFIGDREREPGFRGLPR